MSRKTRKITVAALLSAISVVFLYFAAIIPTGQMGFIALSCISGVAAVIECGMGGGIGVYVCASLLSFLILPNKNPSFIYMLFFGYYPILKSIAEKQKSRVLEWIVKLAVFNVAAVVILRVFSLLTFSGVFEKLTLPVIIVALNVVYVVFDIGVSKVIGYYMARIHRAKK